MSTMTALLDRMDAYDALRWAQDLFEQRDYYRAAEALQHVLDDALAADAAAGGLGEVRELLARSYYHSAQLGRAAEVARDLLEHEPTNAYAALLLARSLERRSRLDEADAARRLAEALGAPA
jgi:Flp pilus assembly protein TadD